MELDLGKTTLKEWEGMGEDGSSSLFNYGSTLRKQELKIISKDCVLCRKCNSVAQVVIDKFGEDYLWNH